MQQSDEYLPSTTYLSTSPPLSSVANDSRPASHISTSSSLYHHSLRNSLSDLVAASSSRTPAVAHTAGRSQGARSHIAVPSFAAFRSHLPDALTSSAQQTASRAASFSITQTSSPRLADSDYRPLSVDSRLPIAPKSIVHNPIHPGHELAITQTPHPQSHTLDIHPHEAADPFDPTAEVYESRSGETAQEHLISHFNASTLMPPTHGQERAHMTAVHQTPTMTFELDGIKRSLTDDSAGGESIGSQSRRPKSPARAIGSFFGWKSPHKTDEDYSPTTTFSERSLSPLPSPHLGKGLEMTGTTLPARLTPPSLDIRKANTEGAYFDNPQTPLLLGNESSNAHVRELEKELSHISQELAGSIRREMELEDELDRIRTENPTLAQSEHGRRGSDYFSDSGASSTRFPITDVDGRIEHLEKLLRKVEQDKANLKIEMAQRLQTELSRRRDLEELVHDLENQIDRRDSVGSEHGNLEDKVGELESSLDETRRRLGQEKQTKENYEELYKATKEELARHRNERDNLRDEVVPQLKAKLEGLEAEAADTQAIIYENTRMQQELAALRGDKAEHNRFNSITEEGAINAITGPRSGLSRSGSLARSSSLRRGGSVHQKDGRQRSGSASAPTPEGVKEVEDQRDALHKALKLLIKRYERQQRSHERAMKKLTTERGATDLPSSRRVAYTKEVSFLKEEVSVLRKRTEDALEQKWQYEKGLAGLKMDLDRAEQETRSLRAMLHENELASSVGSHGEGAADVKLELALTDAEKEKEKARQAATTYRRRAESGEGDSQSLADSANRMDSLADDIEAQIQKHIKLRERLAQAVDKGEQEQRQSTRQIGEMQKRLAGMEDSVLAAQQHSETTLATHDAEMRRLEGATSPRLQRLQIIVPEPNKLSPTSPMMRKSPKLGTKLSETSLLEMSRAQMLERKVKELEGLLREAEGDMQTVVQRVNQSQMEVAELQTERDAALAQMRKLQAMVAQEAQHAQTLM